MTKYGAIPTLAYKDAEGAIDFLTKALGFTAENVYHTETGQVMHAELSLGNAFVMLGTVDNTSDFGKMTRTPEEVGDFNTQSPYFIIEEIKDHYENAIANGANIVMPLVDHDYGGSGYSCKDPEGNIWNFGTYSPYP